MPRSPIPIEERAYPRYDYRALLTSIGSDRDIQNLIGSYGFEKPSTSVIRGWRSRNSVPSRWLPLIVHKGMQDGWLKNPTAFLETPF
jgi:hypothetical protein